MNRLIGGLLAGMMIPLAGPVHLSGQDPSGIWETTFVQAIHVGAGGSADTLWATGELVLALDGDRLTGTWRGVGTWQLEGTFAEGQLRFWTTELVEGDPRLRQIERIEWEGVLEGESLDGVERLTMREGGPAVPRPSPWRAERRGTGRLPFPGSLQCAEVQISRSLPKASPTRWFRDSA